MITVAQKVGRLLEIRMTAPISIEELSLMQRDMIALLNRVQGKQVLCSDLSRIQLFSAEQADWIAKFFRIDGARLERTAFVIGDSATFMMQVERLIREGAGPPSSSGGRDSARDSSRDPLVPRPSRIPDSAANSRRIVTDRRAFRGTAEASAWLDEVLTSEERARLRMFMEQPSS